MESLPQSGLTPEELELPAKAKLAVMKFPDAEGFGSRTYGRYYWRDEEYLKLQQEQVDTLSRHRFVS
jgi:hypothetical protein